MRVENYKLKVLRARIIPPAAGRPETVGVGGPDGGFIQRESLEPRGQQGDGAAFVSDLLVVSGLLPTSEPVEVLGPVGEVILRVACSEKPVYGHRLSGDGALPHLFE